MYTYTQCSLYTHHTHTHMEVVRAVAIRVGDSLDRDAVAN